MVYLFDNGLAPYASYAESFNPQSRGFELEGKASLNDNLDITAAYGYLDNRASKSNSTVQASATYQW